MYYATVRTVSGQLVEWKLQHGRNPAAYPSWTHPKGSRGYHTHKGTQAECLAWLRGFPVHSDYPYGAP